MSLPPPLDPHDDQEDAEGHAVHVVLGPARLDLPEGVARAQTPRAEHVQDTVDHIAVEPSDQARKAEETRPVESPGERIEAVPMARHEVDGAEGPGQAGGVDGA